MKVLDLRCQYDHAFEGWFAGEADFQDQLQRNLVQCPLCGDSKVRKVLSVPRVNWGAGSPPPVPASSKEHQVGQDSSVALAVHSTNNQPQHSVEAAWLRLARHIVANTEDVGTHFADHARRMHHGEEPERPIRGQASPEETAQLREEGIEVLPLLLPTAATETLQ